MFVFVYKGKNFYRGGKRERGGCGCRWRHCCSFFLPDLCGADVGERDFLGCGGGVGGWFLGGSWLRFGEEWSRNEKVFARSVRVFWARSEESLRRKGVPYLSSLPFLLGGLFSSSFGSKSLGVAP